MRIKKFEVLAYRSCIKTSLPLHSNLTGLIGINGAGKSNILNAILILKKIWRARHFPIQRIDQPQNRCQIKVEIEHDQKLIFIKGIIVFETDERNFDEVQYSNLKWNLKELTGESKWIEIPMEIFSFQYERQFSPNMIENERLLYYNQKYFSQRILKAISQSNFQVLREVVDFLSGINYYSASQFSDPSRCPVSIELEENRTVRRPRSYSSHDQFMLDLYRSFKKKDAQFKRYLSTINKEGIGLVDGMDFNEVELPSSSYEVRTGGKIKKIIRNRLLVVPNFNIDEPVKIFV